MYFLGLPNLQDSAGFFARDFNNLKGWEGYQHFDYVQEQHLLTKLIWSGRDIKIWL